VHVQGVNESNHAIVSSVCASSLVLVVWRQEAIGYRS
jgi:hypothetical protein